jgi:hypothetical protein
VERSTTGYGCLVADALRNDDLPHEGAEHEKYETQNRMDLINGHWWRPGESENSTALRATGGLP